MDATFQALADLSDVDHRLSAQRASGTRSARSLEERRAALRESIPEKILGIYDALGREGRHPAIAPLVRGAHCGGCHVRVPPYVGSLVRRGVSVCSCPHCRRLLYFADRPAEPAPAARPSERPARRRGAGAGVSAPASAGSSRGR